MKLFIVVFVVVSILPFAAMPFVQSETNTEKRTLAAFPSIKDSDGINTDYFNQLGEYFDDHFAFRQQIVSLDSIIQSKIFRTSNVSSIVVGNDDWLYYSATVDNFKNDNLISRRGLYNISHNLKLIQNYVESNSGKFVFTVAPNKNTLYGENMPYYYKLKVNQSGNMDELKKILEKDNINYVDLFDLFSNENSEKVLYLKRDSHWSNEGAALVHHEIFEQLDVPHVDYTKKSFQTRCDYSGDLNKMLYPLTDFVEENEYYDMENPFSYVTKTESVEDPWIITENKNAQSSVLMYRDSFGNSLLGFFADSFEKGYFSKSVPYNISSHMSLYSPEYVVIEKVERNITDLAKFPAVFSSPEADVSAKNQIETDSSIEMKECEANTAYWSISGKVSGVELSEQQPIYVKITADSSVSCYEPFWVSDDESDNGFQVYIDKESLSCSEVKVDLITLIDEEPTVVAEKTININEIKTMNTEES
ncbi:MAG: hypothetical protein ACI4GY_07245 [Acutalibacteraceae bacterium]